MNGRLALRQELHGIIDSIPEKTLYALRPLLNVLAYEPDDDVLSDDVLSDDDAAMFLECQKDLKERPETFVSLDDYKSRRNLA